LVDLNEAAINIAKAKYQDIEAHADDLIDWIEDEKRSFKVAIGVWCLCYLDKPATD